MIRTGWILAALVLLLVALGVLVPPLDSSRGPGPGETPTTYPQPQPAAPR